ncbi:MAG: dolichyl-phosphate beta-glucosyltransferase [Patescibacteria group bacterium]
MIKKLPKFPFISIVIPLYNEERRVSNLSKIYKYFDRTNLKYEVILINDGSKDKTLRKLNEISKNFKFNLISYSQNRGKGYAIRVGMIKARGQYRLFTDIDLSTPIEEFNKFLPNLKEYDIIIGSRKKRGSKLIIRQPKLREKLGKGFTKLSQLCLGLNLTDFTCGYKCFSKEATKKIFSKQRINRWGFDTEILFIGKKKGLSIKEIPVIWKNDPETKVKLPLDIITSFLDLLKIRYASFRKLYD